MLALSGLRVAPGCSVRPFPLCPPVFARLAEVQMKSEPLIVISPLSMPACTGGGSREPKMEFAGIYVTRDKVYSLTACSYDEVSIFKTEYPHQLHSYKKSYSTHNGSISKGLSLEIKKIIERTSSIEAITIAGFGPFYSLLQEDSCNNEYYRFYGKIKNTSFPISSSEKSLYLISKRILFNMLGDNNIQISILTDVASSALGELCLKFGIGLQKPSDFRKTFHNHVLAFLKISDGIGGGFTKGLNPWLGALSPEMGDIIVCPHSQDMWTTSKYFNKNCIFSRASTSAIQDRWGVKNYKELDKDHVAWDLQAFYIAQLCVNVTMTISPSEIVLGGRLMVIAHLVGIEATVGG